MVHSRFSIDGNECYFANYNIDDFFHEIILQDTNNIDKVLRTILDTPFDLTKDVLFKFFLLNNPSNPEEFYFLHNEHHIISPHIA